MIKPAAATVAALSLALSACASTSPPAPLAPASPASAAVDLRDAAGRVVARAAIEEAGDSVRVRLEAAGLAPGAYGAHLHTTGRCDPPAFTTAGPHWNPTGRQHGKDNPQGMHLGDLPNLLVGADGRGTLEYTVPGASLTGAAQALLDEDGAAIVVHAQADDLRTDPSGNSGARFACGVVAQGPAASG